MKIEDPNNIILGFILITILPYVFLGSLILIYMKYKSFYKRYKIMYFILLFFVSLYVLFASYFNYIFYLSDTKIGFDSVKITF